MQNDRTKPDLENIPPMLTTRQQQIVELLKQGMSNKEIARELGIAAGTVKVHLHEMFARLGTTSRGKLVSKLIGSKA